MLLINGRNAKLCDGASRREFMRVGGLSLFGSMSLPRLIRANAGTRGHGPAKSVIMFNLLGGPAHMDMFDMKPAAPAEVRGEFNRSVPRFPVCRFASTCPRSLRGCTARR